MAYNSKYDYRKTPTMIYLHAHQLFDAVDVVHGHEHIRPSDVDARRVAHYHLRGFTTKTLYPYGTDQYTEQTGYCKTIPRPFSTQTDGTVSFCF